MRNHLKRKKERHCLSFSVSYALRGFQLRISSTSRSEIMAMNSELVGFPLALLTVYPKYFCRVSSQFIALFIAITYLSLLNC